MKKMMLIALICMGLMTACSHQADSEVQTKTWEQSRMTTEVPEPNFTSGQAETTGAWEEVITGYAGETMAFSLKVLAELFPFVLCAVCQAEEKEYPEKGLYLRFTVEDVLRGDIAGQEITIFDMGQGFIMGEKYLLFAQKWENVFLQTEYFTSDRFVHLGKGKTESSSIKELSGLDENESIKKAVSALEAYPFRGERTVMGEYIKTQDVRVLWEESPFVFRVKIIGTESLQKDRKAMTAEVQKELKGKAVEGKTISVVVPYDLQEGSDYVLFLNKADKNSAFYIISSPYSVFDPEAEELKGIGE